MSHRRWWQVRPDLLETEKTELTELGFSLEQGRMDDDGTIVFTGELRRGENRHRALVVYPPAFAHESSVRVLAPGLPLGRHINIDGTLCLDHPTGGAVEWMRGKEAVERAEELWQVGVETPAKLIDIEAHAPDPRANYIEHQPGSAIVLADVDVTAVDAGVLRVGLTSADPYRGALTGVRLNQPDNGEVPISRANEPFTGPVEACGLWRRLDAPPPGTSQNEIAGWISAQHGEIADIALKIASAHRQLRKQPQIPALVAFVYPDELAWQVYGDQWLIALIAPDGKFHLPRPIMLRPGERFVRQPELEVLGQRRVGIIGVGALGSSIAALLARAGVHGFVLVDTDYLSAGNVVRNDLDLGDVGKDKVLAVAERIRRINPLAEIDGRRCRYGQDTQHCDDDVFEALGGCDLIVNAAANPNGVHDHIAATGREAGKPVVHAWVGSGAWGARIITQRQASGCPECLARIQKDDEEDDAKRLPDMAQGPLAEVMERGCSDPTFTGAGFDLVAAASAATRAAVGELVADPDAYPPAPDLLTLTFRTEHSAVPTTEENELSIHEQCTICNG